MKDDFYKDVEHKRASQAKKEKSDKKQSSTAGGEDTNSLSRAERHRPKDRDGHKATPGDRFKAWRGKFTGYINRENLDKGKAFFAGRLSSYNRRFKDEIKVSKEKLSELRPQKNRADADGNGERRRDRRLVPAIIAGVLVLPLTIILGVLIISNFWPSGNGTGGVADNAGEPTEEASEAPSEEVDEELEDQKAEMERELAESREETDQNDLGTGAVELDLSEDQEAELEEAAATAIEEKEAGEAPESSTSVVEEPEAQQEEETEEAPEAPEEETAEEPEEDSSDEETPSGSTTHIVRPEDNLFRIAIRYYGSGSSENIRKIQEANNGVDADSLSVGQELVIPE